MGRESWGSLFQRRKAGQGPAAGVKPSPVPKGNEAPFFPHGVGDAPLAQAAQASRETPSLARQARAFLGDVQGQPKVWGSVRETGVNAPAWARQEVAL